MEYDNTNSGAVWLNAEKLSEKHPDYKGKLNVGGEEYWLSGWKRREGDNPKAPIVRFKIEKKDMPRKVKEEARPPIDYDLPF